MIADRRRARLAVVGIGNDLAGDDGVGVVVAERLRARFRSRDDVLVETLAGDPFAVADLLGDAERFVFLDAIAGGTPGELRRLRAAPRAFAPSMHHTDIGTVMASLAALEVVTPFPPWEILGVVIDPPEELGEGLSPAVAAAAERLEREVVAMVEGDRPCRSDPGPVPEPDPDPDPDPERV